MWFNVTLQQLLLTKDHLTLKFISYEIELMEALSSLKGIPRIYTFALDGCIPNSSKNTSNLEGTPSDSSNSLIRLEASLYSLNIKKSIVFTIITSSRKVAYRFIDSIGRRIKCSVYLDKTKLPRKSYKKCYWNSNYSKPFSNKNTPVQEE